MTTTDRGRRSAERARKDPEAPRPPKMSPAESGRLGAQKRWGPHGIILRLDSLPPDVRRIVEAILDAEANAQQRKAADVADVPAAPETRRARAEYPAAA
jgi:hypothetical protein